MPHRIGHILPFLNKNLDSISPDGTRKFKDDTKLMQSLLGIGQDGEGVGIKGAERTSPLPFKSGDPTGGDVGFSGAPRALGERTSPLPFKPTLPIETDDLVGDSLGFSGVPKAFGERTSPLPFKSAAQEDRGGLIGRIAGGIASPFVAAGRGIGRAAGKFADVAGDPEQSPGLQRLLGTIATALSAVEPASFQQQLGQAAISSAAGKQADLLRGGAELTGVGGFGISPQERASLVSEALAEREVGAREVGAEAARTGAEARLFGAQTGRIESITGKERLDLEYAKLNQPGGPGKLVDVAINQDGSLSDRLHTYEWNPATGKFDQYVGPKLEPGAGVGAGKTGKEVERFKPLTIEERGKKLDNISEEADRFLEEGGAREEGFFVGDAFEKSDLIKYGQQRDNPWKDKVLFNQDGSINVGASDKKELDKWSRFEAARPYMDLLVALEDIKDKADVTEEEGQKLLDIENNIETLRDLAKSKTRYTEYINRIKAGSDPGEVLTILRQVSGGR